MYSTKWSWRVTAEYIPQLEIKSTSEKNILKEHITRGILQWTLAGSFEWLPDTDVPSDFQTPRRELKICLKSDGTRDCLMCLIYLLNQY